MENKGNILHCQSVDTFSIIQYRYFEKHGFFAWISDFKRVTLEAANSYCMKTIFRSCSGRRLGKSGKESAGRLAPYVLGFLSWRPHAACRPMDLRPPKLAGEPTASPPISHLLGHGPSSRRSGT